MPTEGMLEWREKATTEAFFLFFTCTKLNRWAAHEENGKTRAHQLDICLSCTLFEQFGKLVAGVDKCRSSISFSSININCKASKRLREWLTCSRERTTTIRGQGAFAHYILHNVCTFSCTAPLHCQCKNGCCWRWLSPQLAVMQMNVHRRREQCWCWTTRHRQSWQLGDNLHPLVSPTWVHIYSA